MKQYSLYRCTITHAQTWPQPANALYNVE